MPFESLESEDRESSSSSLRRPRRVELNIDLGELEEESEEFYALCTVANLALGGHAGDERTLRRSVERARRAGVRLAAHPSYPDPANFGRRSLALPEAHLAAALREQFERLRRVLGGGRPVVPLVKPHGALYHDVGRSADLARLLVTVAVEVLGEGVGFVGLPETELSSLCVREGHRYLREGFADRGLDEQERLLPRSEPGALLRGVDARRRALALAEAGNVETICVHGDSEDALRTARLVHAGLLEEGWLRS